MLKEFTCITLSFTDIEEVLYSVLYDVTHTIEINRAKTLPYGFHVTKQIFRFFKWVPN